MRKYGVENVNDHFIAFNTICDATQVIFLFLFPTYPSVSRTLHLEALPKCLCLSLQY
jgi:hypothetical protein